MKLAHMAALMGRCTACRTLPEGVFCEDCTRQHEVLVDSLTSAEWKPDKAREAADYLWLNDPRLYSEWAEKQRPTDYSPMIPACPVCGKLHRPVCEVKP